MNGVAVYNQLEIKALIHWLIYSDKYLLIPWYQLLPSGVGATVQRENPQDLQF